MLNQELKINPLKKNRFIARFPDEFEIPNYLLSSIELPTLYFDGHSMVKYSNCNMEFNLIANNNLMKKFLSIIESGEKFTFKVELLDESGLAMEGYEMIGFLSNLVMEKLEYEDSGNVKLKISITLDTFKAL